MEYVPNPLPTGHVALPSELEALMDQLARNVHEVWAQQRIRDGWRKGPKRDDKEKTHPSLVPYEELSDAERVYDRRTAEETLRMILALGYRIVPPEGG